MYAVVKTGGKQYRVAPGDVIEVEKLDAQEGAEVELPVIFVADGDKIEADPAKAAATKVIAKVLAQFKGKKQLVFKFKKRKGYKKLNGHRQQLTRLRIVSVGAEKWAKYNPAEEKAAEIVDAIEEKADEVVEKVEAAAEVVAEKVEKAVEVVEEKAEAIAEAAEEKAEEVIEAVEEAVEEAASEDAE